jgi:hypothetical protein
MWVAAQERAVARVASLTSLHAAAPRPTSNCKGLIPSCSEITEPSASPVPWTCKSNLTAEPAMVASDSPVDSLPSRHTWWSRYRAPGIAGEGKSLTQSTSSGAMCRAAAGRCISSRATFKAKPRKPALCFALVR